MVTVLPSALLGIVIPAKAGIQPWALHEAIDPPRIVIPAKAGIQPWALHEAIDPPRIVIPAKAGIQP